MLACSGTRRDKRLVTQFVNKGFAAFYEVIAFGVSNQGLTEILVVL